MEQAAGWAGFPLPALPLKFEHAVGALVRAVAELSELPAEKEWNQA